MEDRMNMAKQNSGAEIVRDDHIEEQYEEEIIQENEEDEQSQVYLQDNRNEFVHNNNMWNLA